MPIDPNKFHVESRHPPIWQEQPTFQELMAEQLRHAPWLLLSILIHGIAVLIIMMIPSSTKLVEDQSVKMQQEKPPEEIVEEEEPEEEPEEETPEEEPVLQDTEIVEEVTETEVFDDIQDTVESAFDSDQWNTAVGLGGGAGGKFGGRRGGRRSLGQQGGRDTAKAIEDGLEWLKKHQDEDGKWDADDFSKHDIEGEPCDGPGNPTARPCDRAPTRTWSRKR
jgi:hypothetical protein